jgi:hypothetical protein
VGLTVGARILLPSTTQAMVPQINKSLAVLTKQKKRLPNRHVYALMFIISFDFELIIVALVTPTTGWCELHSIRLQ